MVETILKETGAALPVEDVPKIMVTFVDRILNRRIANQRQLASLLAVNGIPFEVTLLGFPQSN